MIKNFNDFLNEDTVDDTASHGKNYMVISNLKKLERLASALLSKIDDSSDVDEWAVDHIATSADDVEEVFNYMEGNPKAVTEGGDWGSSDQNIMMQSMHKDLAEPKTAPGLDPVLTAAEEAVDFYWEDWEEYKTDRAGLVNKAAKDYYRRYFPEWLKGMQELFKAKES